MAKKVLIDPDGDRLCQCIRRSGYCRKPNTGQVDFAGSISAAKSSSSSDVCPAALYPNWGEQATTMIIAAGNHFESIGLTGVKVGSGLAQGFHRPFILGAHSSRDKYESKPVAWQCCLFVCVICGGLVESFVLSLSKPGISKAVAVPTNESLMGIAF